MSILLIIPETKSVRKSLYQHRENFGLTVCLNATLRPSQLLLMPRKLRLLRIVPLSVWEWRSAVKTLMSWWKATVLSSFTFMVCTKRLAHEISCGEEKVRSNVPSAEIKEMCAKWGDVRSFVEKYPKKLVANRANKLA